MPELLEGINIRREYFQILEGKIKYQVDVHGGKLALGQLDSFLGFLTGDKGSVPYFPAFHHQNSGLPGTDALCRLL